MLANQIRVRSPSPPSFTSGNTVRLALVGFGWRKPKYACLGCIKGLHFPIVPCHKPCPRPSPCWDKILRGGCTVDCFGDSIGSGLWAVFQLSE